MGPGVRILLSPPKFALSRTQGKFWRDLARQFVLQIGEADPPFRNLMYYVYILLNESKTRTYTGVAEDVDKRLTEHNAGRVKSSSPCRPYKVIHIETFLTLSEARQREKFYKSTTGRRRIKEMFFRRKKNG